MTDLCPECEGGYAVLGYGDEFGTYGMENGMGDISWNPEIDMNIIQAPELEKAWWEALIVPVAGTVLAGLILYWATR